MDSTQHKIEHGKPSEEYRMTDAEYEEAMIKSLEQSFRLDKVKGSYEIAEYLVERYSIKTIGEREREVFIYENGIYVPGINFVRKWLHSLLKEECRTHAKNEILEKVKDLSASDRSLFTVDTNYINLNNGILDLGALVLIPHDPKYLFLNKIPVNYEASADCPQIKRFLHEILDADSVHNFQEFIGYALYRRYPFKKAAIFVGEPNTGKTTLLRVINNFFGPANVSGVSLHKITSDKFAAAHLYNKHINTFDDLSFKDITDTGAFKIVTGGGSITAEYKFGSQFQFENYAKLIFACNKIPDVKETDDDAYFSRWIIFRFNKEVEKIDNFLIDKLTTPEELSGFLNFALAGLKRLFEQKSFSYQKDPEEIKAEMMQSGSSIASFVATCLAQEPGAWISKTDMYTAFQKYALENGLTILTMGNFGKKIAQHTSYIADGKKLVDGKQVTGWRNVKVLEDKVQPFDQKEEAEASTDSIPF